MPSFATPGPISVTVDLYSGQVRLVATDRTDTVVEVRPSDPTDESDVRAAEQTRVEFDDGTLTVRGPKSLAHNFSRKTRSVDVTVALPAGSAVHGDLTAGDFHGTGVLGRCVFKTMAGKLRLERTAALRLSTSFGPISVEAVDGDLDAHTGSGTIRIGDVGGTAAVKNANGNTELGAVTGTLRARASNGDITVERADAGVDAKTSNGTVRVGRVSQESVTLHTAAGDVEVGVAAGTAAWLDLKTGHGRVHNTLSDLDQGPEKSERTVEIRAHTSYGDITVHRS